MEIRLESNDARPLYVQLRDALRQRLLAGVVPRGARLPATRELAKTLRVSRNTVEEAYALLIEEGLITTRRGQGAFSCVSGYELPGRAQDVPAIDWEARLSPTTHALVEYRTARGRLELRHKGAVSFASMAPDHHEFEVEAFRHALQDVLAREGGVLLSYGYTRGYEPLRRYVAEYLSGKGLRMQGQEILICDGFRQGAGIAVRALCPPGGCVAVENPTYNGFLGVLRAQGVRAVGVPCDEAGMIPEALETILLEKRPSLLYVVPTYHNPTGRNMPLERRRAVLDIAARHGVPVLEDGFSEELRFAGECYPALKALDDLGNVLYVGSYSKVLFPGLRIGWLVVPKQLFAALEHLKYNEDISSPPLTQAALYEYCQRGGLERHLRRCRPIYRARMEAMHGALEEHFAGRAQWKRSEGGFGAWVRFPEGFDARAALPAAREAGVLYAPGDAFYVGDEGANTMRLGFSRLGEEDIWRGIAVLSDVLRRFSV
jgi:DNA-binding transcriptional MocR family regulator